MLVSFSTAATRPFPQCRVAMIEPSTPGSRPTGDAAAPTNRGHRIGPISVEIVASATKIYTMMTTFEDGVDIAAHHGDPAPDPDEHIREFTTVVSLPLGCRRSIRTREAIRLVPPNAIRFRHLAGPVRGLAEVISVESLGEGRCRVTYKSVLPWSGLLLRLAYRILARPAIERIVRSHLADLAKRAEAETRILGR